MEQLMRNWKILLLVAALLISFASITISGLEMGIDFKGGTLFQLHLEKKPSSAEQLTTITSIIEHRVNSLGLKDTKVTSFGDEFITVQIAETNPKNIDELEVLLKTQGKFEATLEGEVLFTGSEIRRIIKDPAQGYGFSSPENSTTGYSWSLPFTLEPTAAGRFSKGVFHKCTLSSFNTATGNSYDCERTYFFIDRPVNAVLVLPGPVFENDKSLLLQGNFEEDISPETNIEELLLNADTPYIILDSNFIDSRQKLNELLSSKEVAILHPSVPDSIKEEISAMGYIVKVLQVESPKIPWIWRAVGAKQIISITPGIANLDPFVAESADARIFSDLFITGNTSTPEEAQQRLTSLTILLETGSLPVSIDSISRETITPYLGQEFLQTTFLMGIAALVVVSLVIFIRYKNLKLGIPIMITALSEVTMQ